MTDQPTRPPTTTEALATRETPATTTVITTPAEYERRVSIWQQRSYHVLSPLAQLSAIPVQFVLMPALVTVDPDPRSGEVYRDQLFCEGDEVAIAKPGLAKIALAAGMSIRTERTDPRTLPHYWEVRATARFVGIDGTVQEMDATAEYDLRDGAPRITKIIRAAERAKPKRDPTNQIEGARQYGLRGCEARAINAVIRQYGIRQKYSRQDLEKPFVVLRVVYQPDMSDPAQAQAVTRARIAGTSLLFGDAPRALPAPPTTPEPIDAIGVDAREVGAASPTTDPGRAYRVRSVAHDLESGHYRIQLELLEARDSDERLEEEALTPSNEIARAFMEAKKADRAVAARVDPTTGLLASFAVLDRPSAAGPSSQSGTKDPAPGLHRIAHVKRTKTGTVKTGKRAGQPWTLYEIAATTGEIWTTFDDKHASDADEAKTRNWPVRIVAVESEQYPDQLNIETITLVDPRQGTLPIGDQGKF